MYEDDCILLNLLFFKHVNKFIIKRENDKLFSYEIETEKFLIRPIKDFNSSQIVLISIAHLCI